MSVIDMQNKFQQKKNQNQVITHVARVDLIAMAVLYFLHVKPNRAKAQSLLNAFSTQALDRAAIELTREQYLAFKEAATNVTDTIDLTFQKYMEEADERS